MKRKNERKHFAFSFWIRMRMEENCRIEIRIRIEINADYTKYWNFHLIHLDRGFLPSPNPDKSWKEMFLMKIVGPKPSTSTRLGSPI